MTPPEETAALERVLAEAGVSLPWTYRPYEFADWGFIRGPEKVSELIGPYCPIVAHSRQSDVTEEQMADHRLAKTDPYEPVGRLIVAAVNSLPRLLDLARRAEAAEKRVGELEAGLEPFALGARMHKNEPGCGKILVPCTVADLRAARALITPIAEGR